MVAQQDLHYLVAEAFALRKIVETARDNGQTSVTAFLSYTSGMYKQMAC